MFTRSSQRRIRLDPIRRAYPALALLLATLVASAGCAPMLNRITREVSPTTAQRTAVAQPRPAASPARASAVNVSAQPVAVLPAQDWDIPDGHFYTQTNGQPPRTSPTGFAVTNRDGIPFWSEFQRLGGPMVVGFPVSPRLTFQGQVTQVFQRAILQWNAQARQVQPTNVLLSIEEAGKGEWLAQTQKVPARLPANFDLGKTWDQTVRDRLALLSSNKPMEDKYRSAPDALALYGLPDSRVVDMGDHQAIRTQRTVLRLWKQDRPWAKAGEVTADNSGEYAIQAGLFPPEALATEQPPTVPVSLEQSNGAANATPAPAAPTPTPATQVTLYRVGDTDGDGVYLRRTPKLTDKLSPWPDGTLLRNMGEQAQGDGLAWYKVQAPDGNIGWVPARYAKPVR